MSTIYVDNEFKCHIDNPDGVFLEIKHEFFNNKCKSFIEGYCYDDSKGYVQIYPFKPYSELDQAQRKYERQKLSNCLEALQELGVET